MSDATTNQISPPPSEPLVDPSKPHRADLADGAFLLFWPALFQTITADALFRQLLEQVTWEQMLFRGRPEPRLTAWVGDYAYRYSGLVRWPAPIPPVVRALINIAECLAFGSNAGQYTGVLLNRYRDGNDRIGRHSDAEADLMPDAPITSFSFGTARRFILRNEAKSERLEYPLGHGSALVMGGTLQRSWTHEIPMERRCGSERISLTFRQRAAVVQ